jgi:hypothetical protein
MSKFLKLRLSAGRSGSVVATTLATAMLIHPAAPVNAAIFQGNFPIWPAVTRLSSRKLQFPLNRLEARLLAQGIQERVGLQILQARIPQPPRRLEPFERLCLIAPLRE